MEDIDELRKKLAHILTEEKAEKRYLIAILQAVQKSFGYIPKESISIIADFLNMPGSSVWGVVTFYNQFRLTPLGKHPVSVCMGSACHMAGGHLVLDAMSRELEIEVGGITEDKRFSLDRVACVGCCALAPAVVIGDEIYSRMNPNKVEEVLVSLNNSKQTESEEQ